jgi:ABC-2 type transport system ATP-binding protein
MKQRLGIAMALLPDPSLLLLDEPANGLDPVGIIETRELLIRLNREHNKTIFVSSHLLSEVEKTCTHVGIIHKGVLRFQGSLHDLQQSAGEAREVIIKINEAKQWLHKITELFPGVKAGRNNEFNITFETASEVPVINNKLVQAGIPVSGLRVREGLEEWFVKMTEK